MAAGSPKECLIDETLAFSCLSIGSTQTPMFMETDLPQFFPFFVITNLMSTQDLYCYFNILPSGPVYIRETPTRHGLRPSIVVVEDNTTEV